MNPLTIQTEISMLFTDAQYLKYFANKLVGQPTLAKFANNGGVRVAWFPKLFRNNATFKFDKYVYLWSWIEWDIDWWRYGHVTY